MERVRSISSQEAMVVLLVVAIVAYLIRPVLLPFVLAAAVAIAATPAVTWLTARTGWRRWISAVVVFVVLVALLGAFGWLTLPSLVQQLETVATNLEGILQRAIGEVIGNGSVDLLGRAVTANELATAAVDWLRGWLGQSSRVIAFATIGSAAFFGLVLFLVLILYFLVSGPGIGEGLLWLVPPEQRPFARHTCATVGPVLKRYFLGLAAVVCYASAAAYLGLGVVLELPGALLLALLTGFLELVPMIGPATSAVLAGLVAIENATGIGAIIGYAVYATLLRLSIDQLIGPLVLGRAAYLHPVLIIFCFLAGGYLFGVVGLVLAVPVALTIRIVLKELYEGADGIDESGTAQPGSKGGTGANDETVARPAIGADCSTKAEPTRNLSFRDRRSMPGANDGERS